jgi:hypothetical protein
MRESITTGILHLGPLRCFGNSVLSKSRGIEVLCILLNIASSADAFSSWEHACALIGGLNRIFREHCLPASKARNGGDWAPVASRSAVHIIFAAPISVGKRVSRQQCSQATTWSLVPSRMAKMGYSGTSLSARRNLNNLEQHGANKE